MNLILRSRRVHLNHRFTLVWVSFDPSLSQIETQEFSHPYLEGTFLQVGAYIVLSDPLEHPLNMLSLKHLLTILYDHIIHVYLNDFSYLFLEDLFIIL